MQRILNFNKSFYISLKGNSIFFSVNSIFVGFFFLACQNKLQLLLSVNFRNVTVTAMYSGMLQNKNVWIKNEWNEKKVTKCETTIWFGKCNPLSDTRVYEASAQHFSFKCHLTSIRVDRSQSWIMTLNAQWIRMRQKLCENWFKVIWSVDYVNQSMSNYIEQMYNVFIWDGNQRASTWNQNV